MRVKAELGWIIHHTARERNFLPGYGFYLLICWALMVFPSCGPSEPGGEAPAVIVGSRRLTLDQLKGEMEFVGGDIPVPAKGADEVRDRLIEQVIDYCLVLEYGRRHNISIPEKEFQKEIGDIKRDYPGDLFQKALLRGYVDQAQWERRLRGRLLAAKVISQVLSGTEPPSYEEIKAYYLKNRDEFSFPEMIRFRQILCRSEKEAKALRDRVLGGEDMGKLAEAHSIAPEAAAGGDVGWVARGYLDKSMEDVLFSLEPGKVSPVIKTWFGFHIFQVISRRPGGVRTLAEVMDQIESRLISRKQEIFYRKWVKGLRSEFKVEIDRDVLNGGFGIPTDCPDRKRF